jgi:uncharacterized repeat protein (TIGR01451 family)
MQSYLGVDSMVDDVDMADPLIGTNDFAGLGPYDTQFTDSTAGIIFFSDYTDNITPNSNGSVAFVDDAGHQIAVNTANTVFFAFAWETIAYDNAANGQAVMQAVIDHLTASLPQGFLPDETATITVTVQVDPAASGVITHTAEITAAQSDPQPLDNSAVETTTIQAAADLGISKSGPADILAGELLTYTLTYSNAGSLPAPNVIITDIIPVPTVTVVSVSSSGAAITATGGADFVWQVADLSPGAGGVITITTQVDGLLSLGAVVINAAEIDSSAVEGNRLNNRSEVSSAGPACLARVFDGSSNGPIRTTAHAAGDEATA